MKGVAIVIFDEHADWIYNNNDFDLSKFVRDALDKHIEGGK